jgi:solute carrier family 25 phosphate transporter 3
MVLNVCRYKGLIPTAAKQVPYTATKFVIFEATRDAIYEKYPQKDLSKVQQLCVSTVSGFAGGVASAVASQPADAILTRINAVKSEITLVQAVKDLGFKGLLTGLTPRLGMFGAMASLQLLVYDGVRVLVGLPVTQGVKKP